MIKGCITALVTPFKAEGDQLDEAAFVRLIERQIDQGIQGILIMGSTGEGVSLSSQERRQCIQLAVQTIKKRVPLIVNVGTNQLRRTLENIEEASSLGADYGLCISPYYLKTSQEGIFRYCESIDRSVSLPLILYNVPSRTALDISLETVARIASLNHFVAIKEANCAQDRYAWYQNHLPPDFSVFIGDDDFVLTGYQLGARGLISVASNVCPHIMRQLCDALDMQSSDLERATLLYKQYRPLFTALFLEPNPMPVKWLLSHMGIISSDMRLPLVKLDPLYQIELSSAVSHLI